MNNYIHLLWSQGFTTKQIIARCVNVGFLITTSDINRIKETRTMISFTLEQIEEAMAEQSGFCIRCGAERACCEPDARNYECEECGERAVYGAEELVIMGLVS